MTNYKIKRFSFLGGIFNPKKETYSKLKIPKEKLEFLKENFPKRVSSIHLNFLELEEKIKDQKAITVTYEGIVKLDGGLFKLSWENNSWYDFKTKITRDLRRYLISGLRGTIEYSDNLYKLFNEIRTCSWLGNKKLNAIPKPPKDLDFDALSAKEKIAYIKKYSPENVSPIHEKWINLSDHFMKSLTDPRSDYINIGVDSEGHIITSDLSENPKYEWTEKGWLDINKYEDINGRVVKDLKSELIKTLESEKEFHEGISYFNGDNHEVLGKELGQIIQEIKKTTWIR